MRAPYERASCGRRFTCQGVRRLSPSPRQGDQLFIATSATQSGKLAAIIVRVVAHGARHGNSVRLWSPRPQAQQLARELQRLLRRQPRHRRGHAARRAQQESAQGVQKQANPRAQRSHRETQAAAGGSSSRAPAAATLPTSAAAKAAACTPWRCLCLGDLSHTTKTVPLRRTTRHASHSLRTEERTCARSVSAQQQQA